MHWIQLEMSDLLDEDIEITDETAVSGDCLYVFTYVGVITSGSRVIKVYPKYLLSKKEEPVAEMKQVIKVLERYSNSEEQIINIFNGDGDNRSFNILAVILFLLKDYHEYGIYTNSEDIVEVNGEGEILWGKSIDESFAIIEDNKPYYMELYTGKTVEDDTDYFKRLHECVITECSKQLGRSQLDELFDIDTVELSEETLLDFGDRDYVLERLHKELNVQFNTRRQILLKTIYTYISQENRMLEENDGISMFGTTAYHAVWEKVYEMYKKAYDELELMLEDSMSYSEKEWQRRIYEIICVLYPKYIARFREIEVGTDGRHMKTPDFMLVDSAGFVDILEIKKPDGIKVVSTTEYRNNYVASRDLEGAIVQIEKYIYILNHEGEARVKKIQDKVRNHLPSNFRLKVVNPQGILLLGRSNNLTDEQLFDFEIIKRQHKNIVDIMTYDDLLKRFRNILNQIKNIR